MSIVELTPENHDTITAQEGIVLVDCHAAWCRPCQAFEPIFRAAAAAHSQHRFAKLDTVAHEALSQELGIEHIPTLLVYRDGILLLQRPGTLSASGLEDVIGQAEQLDMDMVRADIARAQAEASATPTP